MRILVIYKKSYLEMRGGDRRSLAALPAADRARFLKADVENRETLREVVAHLRSLGARVDAVHRGDLARRRSYDLVVSVGGDGTFLAAAGQVVDTPLFGVNSDPAHSLGLWTCADRHTFRVRLADAIAGRLEKFRLGRLRISINGEATPELAFNDVLFASRNPAAMTKYRLSADARIEAQRSSGMWIATAAGSTAGIRSAGGRRMPLSSTRVQYVVREPYTWPARRYALTRGFAARLAIVPLGPDASLWIDGARTRKDLALGDRVEIRPGPPLTVFGLDLQRRVKLFP
jgi:NAD+ kinase